MIKGDATYWHVFEGIGTTRQLMGSQGQVVDAYAYDAWGNDLVDPQSPIPNPFKYVGGSGYYADHDSGLMLLGKRYYCAGVGRFWSLDPAKDGFNWYGYGSGNPARYIDPTGLGCLDKGLNDPTCWWYWMRQRETWCEVSPWHCCMYSCFFQPVTWVAEVITWVILAIEKRLVGFIYMLVPEIIWIEGGKMPALVYRAVPIPIYKTVFVLTAKPILVTIVCSIYCL